MCTTNYDERAKFWHVTYPKSRRRRRCNACQAAIEVGEQYRRINIGGDGTVWTEAQCAACAMTAAAFSADPHHHLEPPPSYLWETLQECFQGARRDEPGVQLWRDLMAGMKRRYRTAPKLLGDMRTVTGVPLVTA